MGQLGFACALGNVRMSEDRSAVAVVLAAGQGVRMRSKRAKVLHEVCGLPMLAFVLDAVRDAGVGDTILFSKEGAIEELNIV